MGQATQVSIAAGREGVVAADHVLAAAAGRDLLQAGGNAIDASIAAALVLSVVLPQASGLGGDVFALVSSQGSSPVALNASGRSPRILSRSDLPQVLPARGGESVCSPGAVAGWYALHERFGSAPWQDLFDRAIHLSEHGFPVSRSLAGSIVEYRSLLSSQVGWAATFTPDGDLRAAGENFQQPALAATLRRLAKLGPSGFYQGSSASSIAEAVQRSGGKLDTGDLAHTTADWVAPLTVRFAGRDVHVPPPNSFGLYLLLQLKQLEGSLDPDTPGEVRISLLMRAAQQAFEIGAGQVADPSCSPRPLLFSASPQLPSNLGGTAVVLARDKEGNAISLVQSVFLAFGSGVVDVESGVVLNNRMLGFSLDPGHPNAWGPAKRPAHTLCPCIVTLGQEVEYLLGTPGGPGQTITLAQVITNVLSLGMEPAQAVTAPRWSLSLDGQLIVEPELAHHVARLHQDGLDAHVANPASLVFGSAQISWRDMSGVLHGAVDQRREGCVQAL